MTLHLHLHEMSQITVNGCFSKVEEKTVLQWAKKFLLIILQHFIIIDPANVEISKNPQGNVLQSGIVSLYVNHKFLPFAGQKTGFMPITVIALIIPYSPGHF